MTYVITNHRERRPPRRGRWTAAGIVIILILAVGAFWVGRSTHRFASPTSGTPLVGPELGWETVAGTVVPVSANDGPHMTSRGLVTGFSHTERGAVIAALNISARLVRDPVQPTVYLTTMRQQCYGDTDATIAMQREQHGQGQPSTTRAIAYWYRILAGSPEAATLTVSIAAQTPQSISMGGYAAMERTLRWSNGDWLMRIPMAPATIIPGVSGYVLLGRPS